MNLEQLRKQAKELLEASRAGDSEALERLGDLEPILANASSLSPASTATGAGPLS